MIRASRIRRPAPVTEYLRLQTRFAHLFDEDGNSRVRHHRRPAGSSRPEHPSLRPGGRHRGMVLMDKPFAITLDVGSSLANKTGSWRIERPVYVDHLPPCNHACPAGENIQQWLYLAEEGSHEAAWRQIMIDNPLPAVMGRACFHPCQTACNRAKLDETVGINSVELLSRRPGHRRGLAPRPARRVDRPTGSGGRLGPGGMSAAYHLRRLGHAVVIFEAAALPGGMMRYGIPAYRLPWDIVEAEIDRIAAMGVVIECSRTVDDLPAAMTAGGFDAAFLAVGAQRGRNADIPAGDSARILDAVSLLRDVAGDVMPALGRRVVVYGGGDTAMDAAGTARRLGAEDAVVVYRRTRDRMPANIDEVHDATEEGVRLQWLSTVTRAVDGKLTIEKMVLDGTGFPQPTGEFRRPRSRRGRSCAGTGVGSVPAAYPSRGTNQ